MSNVSLFLRLHVCNVCMHDLKIWAFFLSLKLKLCDPIIDMFLLFSFAAHLTRLTKLELFLRLNSQSRPGQTQLSLSLCLIFSVVLMARQMRHTPACG